MAIFDFLRYLPIIIGLFFLTIFGLVAIFQEKHRKIIKILAFKTFLTMSLLSFSINIIGGLILECFNTFIK